MMHLRQFRRDLKREEQLEKRLHEERIKRVVKTVKHVQKKPSKPPKAPATKKKVTKKMVHKPKIFDLDILLPKRKPSPPKPLCGCVNVIRDSPLVQTSCDLRYRISLGDGIRIGNHTSAIVLPWDQRTITLNKPYTGETKKCLKAYRSNLTDNTIDSIASGHATPDCNVVVRYGSTF